jgi:hypothetical protein
MENARAMAEKLAQQAWQSPDHMSVFVIRLDCTPESMHECESLRSCTRDSGVQSNRITNTDV